MKIAKVCLISVLLTACADSNDSAIDRSAVPESGLPLQAGEERGVGPPHDDAIAAMPSSEARRQDSSGLDREAQVGRYQLIPSFSNSTRRRYIDTTSFRQTGDNLLLVIHSEIEDSDPAQKQLIDAGLAVAVSEDFVYQFECKNRTVQMIHGQVKYADGEVTRGGQNEVRVVPPNSLVEVGFDYACSRRQ